MTAQTSMHMRMHVHMRISYAHVHAQACVRVNTQVKRKDAELKRSLGIEPDGEL